MALAAALAGWLAAASAGAPAVFASARATRAGGSATVAARTRSRPPAPARVPVTPPRPPGGTRGGPGGPPGRGPGPGPGVAGTIAGLSSSGFTLTVGSATYTVQVSASTVYLLAPGWTASRSALASGDPAMVQGTVSGTRVVATAVQVHLWGITAKVTAVSGDTAMVTQPSGRTATLHFTTPPTLRVGRMLQAVGNWQGDTLTVRAWRLPPSGARGPGPVPPALGG